MHRTQISLHKPYDVVPHNLAGEHAKWTVLPLGDSTTITIYGSPEDVAGFLRDLADKVAPVAVTA